MRLAGIEKGGYYPTPPIVAERIATYFHPHAHGRGRLLDPCAGEGLAAASLGAALQCETWGAELSPGRAEKATARLNLLHPVAWQQTTMSDEAVSILFLNPPYSHDGFDGEGRRAGLPHPPVQLAGQTPGRDAGRALRRSAGLPFPGR